MSLHNVLAVLEDDEARFSITVRTAVALAERESARLTLVGTCHSTSLTMWCGPLGAGVLLAPTDDADPARLAGQRLARALEGVPADIPVTTRVLSGDVRRPLAQMLTSGRHDALVTSAGLLRRCRRVRRLCDREGIRLHCVSGPAAEAGTAMASARTIAAKLAIAPATA